MIESKYLAWLAAALLASVVLCQLMRKRQATLVATLQSYVAGRLEWSQKRSKAARLAQQLARSKATQEGEPPGEPELGSPELQIRQSQTAA